MDFAADVALLPLLTAMAARPQGGVLAIDGRAAAGKSTLAARLCDVTGAALVRMDDFFLPPHLRTAQRLAQAGGNIHHERFAHEVLPHLVSGAAFEYGVFDCRVGEITAHVQVPPCAWRVVEGAYSHHPALGDYMHIRAFADIAPDVQMQRIITRNGEHMAQRFTQEWIPMEEAYFAAYDIVARADVVLG